MIICKIIGFLICKIPVHNVQYLALMVEISQFVFCTTVAPVVNAKYVQQRLVHRKGQSTLNDLYTSTFVVNVKSYINCVEAESVTGT